MKFIMLILSLPILLLAQTEFYLSTGNFPAYNGCKVLKDSLPVRKSFSSIIEIYGVLWNPDSLNWCSGLSGFYSSIDPSHPPTWELDGGIYSFGPDYNHRFRILIPVLDTLEHVVNAKYLQYPQVSLTYKASNYNMSYVICQIKRKLFSADSIHMNISSNYTANFTDSSDIPTVRDISEKENLALMTYNNPTDTSIKLITFLYNRKIVNHIGEHFFSLSPALNSYSIMIPISRLVGLLKRKINDYVENDTVYAVFKKQSDYDTLKVHFSIPIYVSMAVKREKNEFKTIDPFPINNSGYIYDLRGQLITVISPGQKRLGYKKLSQGVYIFRTTDNRSNKGRVYFIKLRKN